ncbi:hypothetical protein JTB14_030958 [Gonioctena quinquepunctata]|nr:hypothetical protein JTB14_030958 [Gonioctena quinquepunctata]
MADGEATTEKLSEKIAENHSEKSEKVCFYCKKTTKNFRKCGKCVKYYQQNDYLLKLAFLFISGLVPETTNDNVMEYLKSCALDDGCRLVASWRNSEPFSECTEPREGDAKIPTPTHHEKEFEKNIKVLDANVRSLRNKIDELEAFIADKQIDIICLTEHWMSEDEITTTQIQGYRLAAFSARLQTTGGGPCIFIKDSISFSTIHFGFNLNVEKCIQYCCVCLKDFNINILALYHSSSGPLDTFLGSLDAVLDQIAKQVISAGDFNINLCNVDSSKLQDILNSANLKQTIYQPTRGNNCIDNIFLDSEILLHMATD